MIDKISDVENSSWNNIPCMDPQHNLPMHIYIPPGQYLTHTCPSCGQTMTIQGRFIG